MQDIHTQTSKSIFWAGFDRLTNQGTRFIVSVLLARMIEPSEFGLIGLTSIFFVFSNLLIDGGLSQALIQKKQITRVDVSTMFFLNVFVGILLYLTLYACSPFIAAFFSADKLSDVLRLAGLGLIISSLSRSQQAMLVRDLQFKKLFIASFPAMVLAAAVALTLAFLNYQVWALVWYSILTSLFGTISIHFFSQKEFRPKFEFSFDSVREMGTFATSLLFSSLLYQGFQNVYGLVIAKTYSIGDLAFYNRARSFHYNPANALTGVFNRVLFPVFSKIQEDNQKIVRGLRSGIPTIAFVVAPLMGFLMLAAPDIVVVLLTEKWLPSADLMRWFPIIGLMLPIAAVQLSVVKAKGKGKLFLTMSIIKNTFSLLVLLFSIQFGVLGIVIGQVISSLVGNILINFPAVKHVCGYGYRQQAADILPYVVSTAVSALAMFFVVSYSIDANAHLLRLCISLLGFTAIYLALCSVLRFRGFVFALEQLKLNVTKLIRPTSINRAAH